MEEPVAVTKITQLRTLSWNTLTGRQVRFQYRATLTTTLTRSVCPLLSSMTSLTVSLFKSNQLLTAAL